MKKLHFVVFVSLIAISITLRGSIFNFKNELQDPRSDMIVLPCHGVQYSSDRYYFRATGTAANPNLRTAQRMARLDANANLAASISVTVQSVTERYITEVRVGDDLVSSERFEDITSSVAEQELSNVEIICSETDFDNGRYTVYIAVETPRGDIINNIEKDIGKEKTSDLLFDKKKFEQIFDEEMEKLEKERSN